MASLIDIILHLEKRGVRLRVRKGRVQISPPGSVTARERERLRQHLVALVDLIDRPTIAEVEVMLGRLDPRVLDPHARPIMPCWPCHGTRFRSRDGGPWTCDRCHPSPTPDDPELVWFDLLEFQPTPTSNDMNRMPNPRGETQS